MSMLLILLLGAVLGWLVWNFAGEGGFRLGFYVLIGVGGALCGTLLMGYLAEPLQGVLGQVTITPAIAFLSVSVTAYLDRRQT